MVYNKAIYEGFVDDASELTDLTSVSPLQFAIEATQMDQNLFSALIEMDIAEAASKSNIINLSESQLEMMKEASGEGIIAKIKALIEKFKAFIKKIFDKFITWISNLVRNDAKIFEKYGKYVNDAKAAKCTVKGDAISATAYNKAAEYVDEIVKLALECTNDTSDVAKIKKNISAIEKNLESLKGVNIVDSDDKPIVEKIVISNLVNTVKTGYKDKIAVIKANHSKNENLIRNALHDAEIAQREASTKRDVNRANNSYEAISKTLSLYSQAVSAWISIVNKSIAVERSNFIKIGNWVMKGGEAKTEATVYDEMQDMMLDIANEQFCESTWEIA